MLAQLSDDNDVSELTDECDRFCRYARRIIGAVVTVGVGQVCSNILEPYLLKILNHRQYL